MLKAQKMQESCYKFATKKCAEVHYDATTKFTLLCLFCEHATPQYTAFLQHFEEYHLDLLQTKVDYGIIKKFEKKTAFNIKENPKLTDNLKQMASYTEQRERDLIEINASDTYDPLQLDNKLLDVNDSFNYDLKTEIDYSSSEELDKDPGNNAIANCPDKVTDGDVEYLLKQLVKEEQTNPLDSSKVSETNSQSTNYKRDDTCEEKEYKSTEEMDEVASKSNTIDCNNATNISTNITNQSANDVDWSVPLTKAQLRNQNKRPYKPRNKPNSCTYCGRTFQRRYQLDTHINIHTGLKPHQCDICGRQFRAFTTLQRHLNTHAQRDCFKCQYCEKIFTHRAALLSHELRHVQQRNIPCDECNRRFYTANQMDTHKRKMHKKNDNGELPFACDVCTKRYRSASMLSTHKFRKHYRCAKYECEQCQKKFVIQQQLTEHTIKIHIAKIKRSVSDG